MKVLITGGAGFVGSNLAVALHRHLPNTRVVCMDNLYRQGAELNVQRLRTERIEFHWGDVRDVSSFPAGPFDLIVECSAEPSVLASQDARLDYLFHTNVSGAYNCLEKARAWNSGFLFLSTSRVYPIPILEAHPWREETTRFAWEAGNTPGITSRGVAESLMMAGARSLYGYTKFAVELLIEEYRSRWGLKSVVNRCGVIAGPWQFGKVDQGIAAFWVLAHYFGTPISYIGYGGLGKQVRDFLHIDDLSRLIIEQVRNFDQWDGWNGNVCGGLEISASLLELTSLCRDVTGREVTVSSIANNRADDVRIFIGDCSLLFKRTSWRPQRKMHDIVADISRWISENETLLIRLPR